MTERKRKGPDFGAEGPAGAKARGLVGPYQQHDPPGWESRG